MAVPTVLHLHSTFDLGGKEARAVRLMNAFGDRFRHRIVSAMPGAVAAMDAVDPEIDAELLPDFPPLAGRSGLRRLRGLAKAMRPFDLILTYNFGAMDAVMARRAFGGPPLIHHEDGFNEDERDGQKRTRIAYRRMALPGAKRLVVPSHLLENIALKSWKQPGGRVLRIPNGIETRRFETPPPPTAIPGVVKRDGEVWIGTLAGLRPIKNLPRLVEAYAFAQKIHGMNARLAIVGEGPERERIVEAARKAGVEAQLLLPGFMANPSAYVGLFDIFALSSDSEQFPISLIEAMAAGLPAACTAVGDIPRMVAAENLPLLARTADPDALGRSLARLMGDDGLRRRVGSANRDKVRADYEEAVMIDRYEALYAGAVSGQA
ncbi:glycosyl transferase family 1 [Pacificimonas flava]|uniref:Glycosyl transferase family 1 n=2 Tax=Pacificimonas TaxID=1960290 RepID=A0A219B3M8_9SPHN|nr:MULTISPECIES: glycosyltransferase family 4 protein [Pacificimonas]MBZ6377332.1 glycosyltransferase family 4 protein [Pacificimonas aurantium]OWV32960.1 glycosyl transferase family 1 [Pacificimonas flava]